MVSPGCRAGEAPLAHCWRWPSLRSRRYSLLHHFRTWLSIILVFGCLLQGLTRNFEVLIFRVGIGKWSSKLNTICPINRWKVVKGASVSSAFRNISGLELMITSVSVTVVLISSYESFAWPTIFLRHLLVDLISRSKTSPTKGPFQIERPLNSSAQQVVLASFCLKVVWINHDAALILVLSAMIFLGSPLLAVNRFKHRMKMTVVMLGTNSRWMEHVTQHISKQIQTFPN